MRYQIKDAKGEVVLESGDLYEVAAYLEIRPASVKPRLYMRGGSYTRGKGREKVTVIDTHLQERSQMIFVCTYLEHGPTFVNRKVVAHRVTQLEIRNLIRQSPDKRSIVGSLKTLTNQRPISFTLRTSRSHDLFFSVTVLGYPAERYDAQLAKLSKKQRAEFDAARETSWITDLLAKGPRS